MGNEFISFSARFQGVSRSVIVPVSAVIAVFGRESRQGMSFEDPPEDLETDEALNEPPARGKPYLKLVD